MCGRLDQKSIQKYAYLITLTLGYFNILLSVK